MNTLTQRLLSGTAAAVLSLGLCGAVFAQAAPETAPKTARTGRRHGDRSAFRQLNLTDAQKAQLKAVRDAIKPRREAVMNNASLSEADKKAQLKELRTELREKSLQVLTPEQREKLKAQRAEMKTKREAK